MTVTMLRPPTDAPPVLEAKEYRCPSCGSFVGSSTSTAGWGRFKCPERRCGKWVRVSFEREPKPEQRIAS